MSLLSTYRFFLLLFLCVVLTAMAGWYLASSQADEALQIRKPSAWKLPNWKSQSFSEDIQVLRNKEFFGTKQQQKEEIPEDHIALDQEWRVTGILMDAKASKILIKSNQTKEALLLKTGDKLPDGREITSIQKDSFKVTSQKGEEEIHLFPITGKVGIESVSSNEIPLEDKNEN